MYDKDHMSELQIKNRSQSDVLHNCEDHFHIYSLSAVHSYDLYHINFTSYRLLFDIPERNDGGKQQNETEEIPIPRTMKTLKNKQTNKQTSGIDLALDKKLIIT